MNAKTEKLPQGLRKANACGGGVRPEQRTLFVEATSNEAGNLTREGRNPLALAMGRMPIMTTFFSAIAQQIHAAPELPNAAKSQAAQNITQLHLKRCIESTNALGTPIG